MDYHPPNQFSATLRRLRDSADISVDEIAEGLGVSSSLIYKWLQGSRLPAEDSNYLEQLCKLFDLGSSDCKALTESWQHSVATEATRLRASRPSPKQPLAEAALRERDEMSRGRSAIQANDQETSQPSNWNELPKTVTNRDDVALPALELLRRAHSIDRTDIPSWRREILYTIQGSRPLLKTSNSNRCGNRRSMGFYRMGGQ